MKEEQHKGAVQKCCSELYTYNIRRVLKCYNNYGILLWWLNG